VIKFALLKPPSRELVGYTRNQTHATRKSTSRVRLVDNPLSVLITCGAEFNGVIGSLFSAAVATRRNFEFGKLVYF
jgi:hypothetical protein